ncbi:MAG: hypothetical protein NXY57DRAFT_982646 [Lentinula lateritia]|uniref:SANT domain-containing protein n=1 Tax=Lentinula lateritia TaxID=40482 RepID=A0ABQ8V760_9AGAR|nr:MAG: hypothetical protein NXY57DRAFT_982646 [Lentinula lateritia]KAJ4468959.1 hypothetical protein C8R41DRAFT_925230 [Lentinula lateritia]
MQDENQTDTVNQRQEHLELLESIFCVRDEQSNEDSLSDWSTDEEDRFFAALGSHSALRPDLIAESIGTKNVVQVCIYLFALEDAVGNCDIGPLRPDLEIAMEVTDEWLEAEEEQAAFLRDIELAWGTDLGSQDHNTSEPADANLTSMRNDALKSLTVDHCKVIDKIFRQEGTSSGVPSLPVPETEPEWAAEVSPAERRRLKKRLHMRRKRAEIAGTDIVTDAQRLQRGRKRKAVGSPPYTPSQVNSESEEGSEFEDRHKKRQRKRGLTREQKVLETFIDLGIDAAVCHNQGLDLFHLHPLGRLLTRSRDTSQATTAVSAISLHTIRLLGVILSDYVTRVVHRAIVLGEQEILFKGGRKVWRHENDDIYPETIKKAVTMLGYPTTKAQAFEHLCGEDACSNDGDNSADQEGNDQVNGDNSTDQEDNDLLEPEERVEESDDSLGNGSPLSLLASSPLLSHFELNPPVLHFPTSTSVNSESLIPLETEEELLNEELAEEEILDQRDQALEKIHQDELWAAYEDNIAVFQQ